MAETQYSNRLLASGRAEDDDQSFNVSAQVGAAT
jgi:hypothetical protein